MSDNTHRLTRQDLYQLVWSEPMSQLAKRFGVSDVGLSKACRRAVIPVPERGYWAKRQAGKLTVQQPLPPRDPGMSDEVEVGGRTSWAHGALTDELAGEETPSPPAFPEDIADLATRVRKMVGKATVPKTLIKPHTMIARLLEEDERRREKQRSSPYAVSWDDPVFGSPFERRRLRLLNAMFLVLARCGMKPSVRGREARELSAQVGLTHVSFMLDRVTKRRQPAQTGSSQDKSSPEKLRFQIASWTGATDIRKSWEDSDDSPIEGQLENIVVELIVAGEMQYRELVQHQYQCLIERKAERENEARRKKEEEEQRERERQIKAQKERVERLLSDASALRQATDIRTYVKTVLALNASASDPLPLEKVEAWAAWALVEADRIDPIRSGRFLDTNDN